MKKLFYIFIILNSLSLLSQNVVISSNDKDFKVNYATLTDTISSKIYYTDINGIVPKKIIKENYRIDCPSFESYFITKSDLTKDTIFLNRKSIILNEVIIDRKKDYEIGNIQNFKFKTDYNLSSIPLNMFIGIELIIKDNAYLKKINFNSSKKSNKNQVLRVRIFKKEESNFSETIIGNLFTNPVVKGNNSLDINTPLEKGQYFICLEKVNDEIDYFISIGKTKIENKNSSKSYIISIRNGYIEATSMNMKNSDLNLELMISAKFN
jgi:hypothetical protein